jgi:3-hydroxyacyl-CoA dehydrogenase / enoyl-CoA hydratase / 3-hydroxybutyryl-CoA epimerase
MRNIQFSIDALGVGVAVLDMPGRPFNVFSDEMIDELVALIELIETERPAGVVIASGKAAFMAGADLAMVRGFTTLRRREPPDVVRRTFTRLSYALRRFERLPMPTVAAVNGLALGGGLELAMVCHRRIAVASEAPSLGLPEVLLGLMPGAGGTQRLPRLVGIDLAARMLLDGKPIAPSLAHAAGLVDELSDAGSLLLRACALALASEPGARWDTPGWRAPERGHELLDGPDAVTRLLRHAGIDLRSAHCYPAYGAICRSLIDGDGLALDEAIEVEADNFLPLMLEATAGNMVRTGFLEKIAAPKRAAGRAGGEIMVERIAQRGLGELPARIARRFELVGDAGRADAVLAVESPPAGELALVLRDTTRTGTRPCAGAELRTVGDIEAAEACEIAASSGPLAGQALTIANRLRLVPVVTAAGVPGPCERLLAAARHWFAAHPEADRAGLANAVDLHRLAQHLGHPPAEAPGHGPGDRAAGLALLSTLATEAADCMAEGLVAEPAGLDLLAVFALGCPAWTGGPLSFQDAVQRGDIPGCAPDRASPATPWYQD